MQKTIVITSGYFNPIHPGHIECFELCKALGDELRVIVNNDEQVKRKTGKDEPFQDETCRSKIVSSIKPVDRIIIAIDEDGSVCESIKYTTKLIKETYWPETKIIFGKGGDRFSGNIPEVQVCEELWIEIKDGLGMKIDNSSAYREKK